MQVVAEHSPMYAGAQPSSPVKVTLQPGCKGCPSRSRSISKTGQNVSLLMHGKPGPTVRRTMRQLDWQILRLYQDTHRLGHFSSILPLTSSSEKESLPAHLLAKTAPPHRTVSLRSEQCCRAELVLVGTSTVPQTPIWRHFMERS